ncbi:MAG: LysR family transcriptional regulator [Rickettsiales bacterium]|nr:LysR family transcriptional regulator [Rickettsiales bacterium]
MKEDQFYQIFYKGNIIQPLKGFCTAVEEGCSLVKAGDKLCLSTTAIFKQIRSLEEKLNVKLFKKAPNRVNGICLELTEDGRAFYEKAREVIDKTDGLLAEYLEEKDDKESKILKIGASTRIFQGISLYINDFKIQNPDLDIKIYFENKENGIDKLKKGELDILVSSFENNEELDKGINFVKLMDYKPYLILYQEHTLKNKKSNEITKFDILNNKFIFDYEIITMKSLQKFIDDNNIKTDIDIGNCTIDIIKMLIKNKMCIWFIFDIFLNKEDQNNFIFKKLDNFFPNGSYGYFTMKNQNTKKITKNFADFLTSKKKEFLENKIDLSEVV